MRILETLPPNWNKIKATFPHAEVEQAIFCYGEIVHNPFGAKMTRDLEIHEAVHSEQQGEDPETWWDRYISDPLFRLEQEIQAYGLQLYHLKTTKVIAKDENGREVEIFRPARVIKWYLEMIAKTLSGPLYGNVIDYHKAHTRIRHFLKEI
jgi:hypothetical protein